MPSEKSEEARERRLAEIRDQVARGELTVRQLSPQELAAERERAGRRFPASGRAPQRRSRLDRDAADRAAGERASDPDAAADELDGDGAELDAPTGQVDAGDGEPADL